MGETPLGSWSGASAGPGEGHRHRRCASLRILCDVSRLRMGLCSESLVVMSILTGSTQSALRARLHRFDCSVKTVMKGPPLGNLPDVRTKNTAIAWVCLFTRAWCSMLRCPVPKVGIAWSRFVMHVIAYESSVDEMLRLVGRVPGDIQAKS